MSSFSFSLFHSSLNILNEHMNQGSLPIFDVHVHHYWPKTTFYSIIHSMWSQQKCQLEEWEYDLREVNQIVYLRNLKFQ